MTRLARCALPFAFALMSSGCDRVPWAPTPPPAAGLAARMTAPEPAPSPEAPAASVAQNWFTPSPAPRAGVHLAYAHAVALEVGGGALRAHFFAARDRCLNDPALHCILLHASLDTGEVEGRSTLQADLRLRLPHDQVAPFANALTQPLPGEAPGLARVVSQSTDAEDLGRPLADVAQRTAQLSDYLASLKALGSRLTISVSDLVKIAGETAQAQSQIEAVQAEQRDLTLRVDTESLNVSFSEPAPVAVPQDPIAQTWSRSGAILAGSAARVLAVAIAALPWLPLALVAVLLLALFRVLVFGRRRRRASPEVRVIS